MTSISVRGDKVSDGSTDHFRAAVERAVQDHLARLSAALDLAREVTVPDIRKAAEVDSFLNRASHLSKSQRKAFIDGLKQFATGVTDVASVLIPSDGSQKVREDRKSPRKTSFSMDIEDKEVSQLFSLFMRSVLRVVARPNLEEEVRKASLLLMAASFETFVASSARALITDQPQISGLEKKLISLEELERLGTVGAARALAIDNAVESLMRGGIDDWTKWFANYSVDWRAIPKTWWNFREIDARRNLVAHADSKVSPIYIRLAHDCEVANPPADGSKVDVSAEYLVGAFEQLASFSVLCAASALLVWRKDQNESIYRWATSHADDLFESGHTFAAIEIAQTLLEKSRGRLTRTLDNRLRTTEWLARKERDGVESVRGIVDSHDFSGLDLAVTHLKAIILDDDESAKANVCTLIERGALTITEVRFSRRYASLRERQGVDWMPSTGPEPVSSQKRPMQPQN